MRRGQMEIMGLAVIVILISVAMLFAIRFVVLKEPASYKQSFTQTEMASNMLSSILRTTVVNCNKMTFEEVFQHCAKNQGNALICSGETTCDFLEREVPLIFNATFDQWRVKFRFTAATQAGFSVLKAGPGCPAGFKSKPYPIPLDTTGLNTLILKMDICD